jgi:hypothetical protein
MDHKENLTKKTWSEFRSTGLLLFVNMLLHIFGWVIVVEDSDTYECPLSYPARTLYRGFPEKAVDSSYARLGKYLELNSKELFDEADYTQEELNG